MANEMFQPEDEKVIRIDVANEIDKPMPEESTEEKQTEASENFDAVMNMFEESGLAKRYRERKGREDLSKEELIAETIKSYQNAEEFIDTLKSEKREILDRFGESVLREKQIQFQQMQQAKPEDKLTDEERQINDYIRKQVDPIVAPIQQRLQMQEVINDTRDFANSWASKDKDFATAYYSGKLGNKMDEFQIPPTRKGVEAAYKLLLADEVPALRQQVSTVAQVDKTKRDEDKRKAGVAGQGVRTGVTNNADQLEEFRKWANRPDVTPDMVQERLIKELGVQVNRGIG